MIGAGYKQLQVKNSEEAEANISLAIGLANAMRINSLTVESDCKTSFSINNIYSYAVYKNI